MFSRLALDLYDQGYRRLLPLVPGEKRPRYSNWQIYNSRDARLDEIERWSRVCRDDGIGLAAGPVGAVDLDHKDGEIAFAVREMADQIIGETPLVRIGEPHKSLRLYRTTAGLTTKPSRTSRLAFMQRPVRLSCTASTRGPVGPMSGQKRARSKSMRTTSHC